MEEKKDNLGENNLEIDVIEVTETADGVMVDEVKIIKKNEGENANEDGENESPLQETKTGENFLVEESFEEVLEEIDEAERDETEKIAVIEAVIFMYGEPVSFSRLAEILQVEEEKVKVLVENLKVIYDERKISGLRILIDEEKVQLVTHPNCAEVISGFVKSELNKPLSQSALEVLAIITYRGPISKADIEAIRGVNCAFTLRNLLTRDLVEKVADENNARISLYKTTFKFLRTLGIENDSELPDFEKLLNDKRIDAILYSDSDLVQR